MFKIKHAELLDADWWNGVKDKIVAGDQADVFPYPVKRRFQSVLEVINGPGNKAPAL